MNTDRNETGENMTATPASTPVLASTPSHGDDFAPSQLLPDPSRPFWWFSSSPLRTGECPAGYRIPPEADYWCHEGDKAWTLVDRSLVPPPPPQPRKSSRRARIPK